MAGWRTTLIVNELRSHPARTAVAVVAIALGVAMGYAVHLINAAAVGEFARGARALMGEADLEIRGPKAGFDEELYARVARLPEVEAASPVVEVDARLADRPEALRIVGIDPFRAAAVQPELIGRPADEGAGGLPLLEDDAIFLSPAAQDWLGVAPGDTLRVQTGLATTTLAVRGTLPATGAGRRLGVMDIGAAQWRLGRLGTLQRIDLRLRAGTDLATFRARLSPMLPAGVGAHTPEDNMRQSATLTRAYRANLGVLALVALFTGAFLVFSSQVLAVLRRRAQLALLRVLGVRRGELLRLLLLEAAAQGMLGAAAGLALGHAVAKATLAWAGGDLGAGFFEGIAPQLRVEAGATLLYGLLGIAASVLGSLAPALEAARAVPARALHAGDEERTLRSLGRVSPGAAAIAAGGVLSLMPPLFELPVAGYCAIALWLVGAIALVPSLARLLFARLPRVRSVPFALAAGRLRGAAGRASIGVAGVLVSFSLMAAMAIMVASFRTSLDRWLDAVLPADLYLRAAVAGDSAFFSAADQRVVAATPGIARVEFQRATSIVLDAQQPPVALIARLIDAARPEARLALIGKGHRPQPGEPPPIWVSEAVVDLYGYRVGARVRLPLAGRWVDAVVAGVWRDYARQHGAIALDRDDYLRLTGDAAANEAAVWFDAGAGAADVAAALQRRLPDSARIAYASPGDIRAISLAIFDRSFAVTYLLEAVAVVIGLAGIAVGAGSEALARSREFGMLRHIGVTRRQIGAMLAVEGALLAALGVAAGLLVGGAVALVLIHVVNPQSFHWTMEFHLPWLPIAGVAATLVAAAAATAALAGRRAMAIDAVRAVREDW
jgi:putative ABC transport system permease protein